MKTLALYAISIIVSLSANTFAQHVDAAKLDSAISYADSLIATNPRVFFRNVESLIVWSHGGIVCEKYYHGYKDSLHHIQSQTKSIVSLLMGIAIDKGFVKSENEPIATYFPGYCTAEDTLKYSVTIKDLLTMSAGFEWEEMIPLDDPRNDNMNMYRCGDYLRYALSRPMANSPHSVFTYNSGCPVILAGIIEKATRRPLETFAGEYLFKPMDIQEYYWLKDSTGLCHAGGGLYLKPRDVLNVGVLVLNRGTWEGKRIVSDEWITKMTQPHVLTTSGNAGYGYLWWIRDMQTRNGKTTKVISAEGAGGQTLYIFTDYDLIVAFTEHNYSTPQVNPLFIKESLLPILQ